MIGLLIERVEAASGPDRELDGAIAAALGLNPEWATKHHERQPELFSDGAYGLRARTWLAPKFTASLDAAMTLVPDDLKGDWSLIGGNGFQAEVGYALADAATPALALVAASLRALQHQKERGL